MTRRVVTRLGFVPAVALTAAGLLATVAAPAVAGAEIEVTLGPVANQISHPNLTVEVGDIIVYKKASPTGSIHILEHLELIPGNTYAQNRSRCAAAYTNFEIECHWMDIVVTFPPAADVIGVPGNPPAGNGLFYGITITANPHTYRWDTGVWHDQMVVGYLKKPPLTAPREFILIDALNLQQITHRVTIVPRGWFDPPTLSLPAGVTANATSPDGAHVDFTATATGYGGAAVPVVCSPSSGSLFPIGTTTVSCSAAGNGPTPGVGSFDVHVKGAAAQLQDLAAATTTVGPGKAISNKALEIEALLAAGQVSDACNELTRALPNSINAQIGKKITAEAAAALLADVARIAGAVGCEAPAPAPTGGIALVFPTLLAGLLAARRRTGRSDPITAW